MHSAASLAVTGGNIEANGESARGILCQTADLTISGGTITSSDGYGVYSNVSTGDGAPTISGGTITGKTAGVYHSGDSVVMAINDMPIISASDGPSVVNGKDDPSTFLINGGAYSDDAGDNAKRFTIKSGYKLAKQTEGEYKGMYTLVVAPKDILDLTIDVVGSKTYTGSPIALTTIGDDAKLVVKDGDITLVEGTDYDVTYNNNINTGIATAIITGKGNYVGKVTTYFAINEADSANVAISISPETLPYTGEAKTWTNGKPQGEGDFTVTVTTGEGGNQKTLEHGKDYDLSVFGNTEPGTATVIATLKGNYEGAVTGTFKIEASALPVAQTSDGKFFASLADAVVYANTMDEQNVTVTLLKDSTEQKKVLINKCMTIDLGGHTLTSTAEETKAIEVAISSESDESQDVRMTNGRIVSPASNVVSIQKGSLSLDHVSIQSTRSGAEGLVTSVFVAGAGAVLNANDGITIRDNTGFAVMVNERGTAYINEGAALTAGSTTATTQNTGAGAYAYVEATGNGIEVQEGSASITGGIVITTDADGKALKGSANGSIDVSGGWFSGRVDDEFVHEGMFATDAMPEATPDAKAPFTVTNPQTVAMPEVASGLTYNGKAQTGIKLDGSKTLVAGTEYNLTYVNNIEVGTALPSPPSGRQFLGPTSRSGS